MAKKTGFKERKRERDIKKNVAIRKYLDKKPTKLKLYDLAPDDDDYLPAKQRALLPQKNGQDKPKRRRGPDTRGLEKPKAEVKAIKEFKTEKRDNESMDQFHRRLNQERIRHLNEIDQQAKKAAPTKVKASVVVRKERIKEKKQSKKLDDEKEKEFRGDIEHIPFGVVADRPPSFDDLNLPGITNLNEPKTMSNLEKLNKALQNADQHVKDKYKALMKTKHQTHEQKRHGLDGSGYIQQHIKYNDDIEIDNDGSFQKKRQEKFTPQDRQRLLEEARRNQRKAELEKVKYQAQMAYTGLKRKRADESKRNKVGMSSLTFSTAQIKMGTEQAAKDLAEFERQNTKL